MRTGDERSPPSIGSTAARANAKELEKLGAVVDTGSVTDITPTTAVGQANDIAYTATVADSEGLSYVAYVRMDAGMHTEPAPGTPACTAGQATPSPIAFHALQMLSGVSTEFDRDVEGVYTILQKAFGPTVARTDAAAETLER
ncbi:hypothetical protein T484DRAFT_1755836, partial [Baffinella frigidus]